MIRKVSIRRFKQFADLDFALPGHVVLAGPNNSGKTTLLQAIAAWSLAFGTWKRLNNFQRRGGAYPWAPIARQAFAAVPLRAFALLWRDRSTGQPIEIEIAHRSGWSGTMEIRSDSTEQVSVRPYYKLEPEMAKAIDLATVFVPPMTGLSVEEPALQRPWVDRVLGQGKPGEVLRNLVLEASQRESAWLPLKEGIRRLFALELLPPDASGGPIIAEYARAEGGPRFDIASAGSGFQQVLMLLSLLHLRPGSILLVDEPDAHLHVILQDAIYGELRDVAARNGSQLIIATHSEVIINSVDPAELCVMLKQPRMLADSKERQRLIASLGALSHMDIFLAEEAPGVLYLEDFTDLEILRAWSAVLDHPARELLTKRLFWKKTVVENPSRSAGISAKDHYDSLKLVRDDLPGLEIVDGDTHAGKGETPITGSGLQRLRWSKYEIENYLVHPESLARFVTHAVGEGVAAEHVAGLRRHFEESYPPGFLRNPLGDYPSLNRAKARVELLPPALSAAGLPGFPYTRYHEIASLMRPEEIHAEVGEKLDGICKAFRR